MMAALDQMGRNAGGKLVPPSPPQQFTNAATGSTPEPTPSTNRKNASRRVTRRIMGKKGEVIVIASLAGKGNSAPVGLESGKIASRQASQPR